MPVNANTDEYKSVVGLKDLYVAEVTVDSASAYTADTPEWFAPAAEAKQEPTVNEETQYADDVPYDVMSISAETKITLNVTNIPAEMQAKIMGHVFDAASGRVWEDPDAVPPYMALSFRSAKSNGSYRYYQFLKGKFSMPGSEHASKADSPDFKLTEVVYTAIPTVYEFDLGSVNRRVKRVWGDDDTDNFDGATWFSQVQTPSATTPSGLSLSSSTPTDGATGVSVSADQTLTFNNTLLDNAVDRIVISKADGSQAAATVSLDATKKIITINPGSNLSSSTVYLITYAVEDVYGQTLSGVVNFTTA